MNGTDQMETRKLYLARPFFMKYKLTLTKLVEDDLLFKTMSLGEMTRRTGIAKSYLNRVKNGHKIASYEWYIEFKKKLGITTWQLTK